MRAHNCLCNCVDEFGVNVVNELCGFRSRDPQKPNDKIYNAIRRKSNDDTA